MIDLTKTETDSTNLMARILLRARDLNCKGNGTEEHRLVVTLDVAPEDPARKGTGRTQWAGNAAERVSGGWERSGYLASQRKCGEFGFVPVGTILIAIDKRISHYRSVGRPSYSVGRVGLLDGKTAIDWNTAGVLEHIKVSEVSGRYVHTIVVDGRRFEVS